MRRLIRDGRWEGATAFDLLVDEEPEEDTVLREGRDFESQHDLARMGAACRRRLVSLLAGHLLAVAHHDASLWAVYGGPPGAEALAVFPAWRVDLWRCLCG